MNNRQFSSPTLNLVHQLGDCGMCSIRIYCFTSKTSGLLTSRLRLAFDSAKSQNVHTFYCELGLTDYLVSTIYTILINLIRIKGILAVYFILQ